MQSPFDGNGYDNTNNSNGNSNGNDNREINKDYNNIGGNYEIQRSNTMHIVM